MVKWSVTWDWMTVWGNHKTKKTTAQCTCTTEFSNSLWGKAIRTAIYFELESLVNQLVLLCPRQTPRNAATGKIARGILLQRLRKQVRVPFEKTGCRIIKNYGHHTTDEMESNLLSTKNTQISIMMGIHILTIKDRTIQRAVLRYRYLGHFEFKILWFPQPSGVCIQSSQDGEEVFGVLLWCHPLVVDGIDLDQWIAGEWSQKMLAVIKLDVQL